MALQINPHFQQLRKWPTYKPESIKGDLILHWWHNVQIIAYDTL